MIARGAAPTNFDRDALMLAAQARGWMAALAALTVAYAFSVGPALYTLVVGAAVTALGFIQVRLNRPGAAMLTIAGEFAVVLGALFADLPFDGHPAPNPPMLFFSPAVLVLVVLIAVNAAAVRPFHTWWAGACALSGWFICGLMVLNSPHTLTKRQIIDDNYGTLLSYLEAVTEPRYFNTDVWVFQLAVLAGVTVILAIGAHRMRAIAAAAARRAAHRASLAAHFAGPVVETLLARGLEQPGETEIAVVDCDLIGFTALAATLEPEAVAQGLRAFHAFVETRVHDAGGAVLKYVGDGVIAVFGLTGAEVSAAASIACAERLIAEWPQAGAAAFAPHPAPAIAAGVDFGKAVAGLVGKDRSMSLVVTGAPVDGAARLQAARADGALSLSPTVRAAAEAMT